MLVCQATTEPLRPLTTDKVLAASAALGQRRISSGTAVSPRFRASQRFVLPQALVAPSGMPVYFAERKAGKLFRGRSRWQRTSLVSRRCRPLRTRELRRRGARLETARRDCGWPISPSPRLPKAARLRSLSDTRTALISSHGFTIAQRAIAPCQRCVTKIRWPPPYLFAALATLRSGGLRSSAPHPCPV
jgi:hypothetical protein